jgi:hypothetical protein
MMSDNLAFTLKIYFNSVNFDNWSGIIHIMVSLTAIALGVSVITTSLLTLHDTLKQANHA